MILVNKIKMYYFSNMKKIQIDELNELGEEYLSEWKDYLRDCVDTEPRAPGATESEYSVSNNYSKFGFKSCEELISFLDK